MIHERTYKKLYEQYSHINVGDLAEMHWFSDDYGSYACTGVTVVECSERFVPFAEQDDESDIIGAIFQSVKLSDNRNYVFSENNTIETENYIDLSVGNYVCDDITYALTVSGKPINICDYITGNFKGDNNPDWITRIIDTRWANSRTKIHLPWEAEMKWRVFVNVFDEGYQVAAFDTEDEAKLFAMTKQNTIWFER